MKTGPALIILFSLINISLINAQTSTTEVYLLTCDPGPESYTMYGHSALRLYDSISGTDVVYNWGVFDFSTPNFNLKFASGRLNYRLAAYSYKSFLNEYRPTKRSVYSQRLYIPDAELLKLKRLLNENLKPENVYYKYDFFRDNCSTRIRDIIEEVYGDKLVYPEQEDETDVTFRTRIDEFQKGVLWMDAGIDLLLGSPADEECNFRESMFLPEYLMKNLSQAHITDGDKRVMLLGPTEMIFDYERPVYDTSLLKKPWFWLTMAFIVIFLFTIFICNRVIQNAFDLVFWTILTLLALLMIFLNYITDHEAMGQNFNMIWLNPLIPIAYYGIFSKYKISWFWRVQIALAVIFMLVIVLINQSINPAFVPVILIIIIRSYYRLAE
ncbi:MAG TPA: DUF4105 domain-containing protein [Bacteroidetes bacterium]|nr:DUF4105 domain-containing protein [Bacteroidota bacterium]